MFSTPKVAGDLLFIAGLDGVTYSLDASSGRVRWKRKLAAALSKRWPQGQDIYVGTNDQRIYRLRN